MLYPASPYPEFTQLQRRSGQLTSGVITDELLEEPRPKKRRNLAPRSVAPTIAQQFQAADVSGISKVSCGIHVLARVEIPRVKLPMCEQYVL